MKFIDLHTHTTFSDGTLTPTQLFKYAKEKGISALAITDHDTINGLDEALDASKKYNIELIIGIELTCFICNVEVHILGYMFDKNNNTLLNELDEIIKSRINRNHKMIKKLNDIGINISYAELLAKTGIGNISRTQFATVLVEKGYCRNKDDAFEKYLNFECDTYVPRKDMTATKVINLINNAGGFTVLAHPFRYKISQNKLIDIINNLMECQHKTGQKN